MDAKNEIQHSNKRIAINTVMLYVRMFFILGLGLLISRYILEALGIEDYGIYNVVAGVVSLFSFISVSMNSASSRFLTVSIGLGDKIKIKETFKGAFTVHLLIALIVLALAETIGLWIVLHKLVIPIGQFRSALIAYQIAILISVISIIQTPFSAILIAYEKMGVYAGIEIINILLKFLSVLILFKIVSNRLVVYMLLLLGVAIVIFCIYYFFYKSRFSYLSIGLIYSKQIVVPMLTFSGWDLYGNMSVVARSQGVNILLNIFFGPILNAASGLAGQIQSAVMTLSSNIVMAAKPQIIKSYASDDTTRCLKLISIISKITTSLLLIICIPLIINMDYILNLWLTDVPIYTSQFAIWCILFALVANLSNIIMSAIHATGKIKRSSLWNGTLYLLVIPISYISFKFHSSPVIPFIINALAVVIGLFLNIKYLSLYIEDFVIGRYLGNTILPILLTMIVAFGCSYVLSFILKSDLIGLVTMLLVNSVVILSCTYAFLLNSGQRQMVLRIIKDYKNKKGDEK